ncbi:MAG TPA: ABC transporter permease [Gemmatimonadaceae bacterium]|nr:ABC transporter permease [Gemmatimonadaceae bacterium]
MGLSIRKLVRRIRALVRPGALDRELDEEVRLHVALEAKELERLHHLSPADARRRALVAFGGIERYKEAHRDARGTRWLDELQQDIRYAARALRRGPTFTISAVAILALGIGACTAVFSVLDAVVISHLPYPNDDRLVQIFERNSPTNQWPLSVADFQAIQAWQRSFTDVGLLRQTDVSVAAGGAPQRLPVGYVTSGFLRTLGVKPAVGRPLGPADDAPGAPPAAVVTHHFAVEHLGGDRAALGKTVDVDDIAYSVVGVLDARYTSLGGRRGEVWPDARLKPPDRRGPFGMVVIGRLKDGLTIADAARDLERVSRREFVVWQASFQDHDAKLVPVSLRRVMLGDAPKTLALFSAAVVLVMLIAVSNVAGLMLVRAAGRWREVSLRAVLGATRARVARLLITESIMVSLAGAAAGVALGTLGVRVMLVVGPRVSRLAEAHVHVRAIVFAVVVALISGLIIGAYPVIHLARERSAAGVLGGERSVGGTRGARMLRAAFVVAEFALALPLLAAAALLLNSVLRLQRTSPGFDPSHVLTVNVSLPSARYSPINGSDTAISSYWTRALNDVREVPGVVAAGLADQLPLSGGNLNENNFDLVDKPVPAGTAQPVTPWTVVTKDYFAALGVRLLDGRMFLPSDTGGQHPVLLVSRSWANRYFPDGTAIGRKLVSGGCTSCPLVTVIGIVSDVTYTHLGDPPEGVYEPMTEGWGRTLALVVRTSGDPAAAIPAIGAALRSVEPSVTVADALPMADRLSASIADPRHAASLVAGVAIVAALLAAIGVFGTLSYTVSMRRREIGVRLALGARRRAVTGMIVGRGMAHAGLGAAIGVLAALLATRWLRSKLFEVSPTDPLTFGLVIVVLLMVALAASWAPARRAARIDLAEAIRDA